MARTVFKEATDFIKAMWRKFLEIGYVTVFRIINANCNYLIIFLSLVIAETDTPSIQHNVICKSFNEKSINASCLINHGHKANGSCPKKTARYHRFLFGCKPVND
jgi:hypothetical protein